MITKKKYNNNDVMNELFLLCMYIYYILFKVVGIALIHIPTTIYTTEKSMCE